MRKALALLLSLSLILMAFTACGSTAEESGGGADASTDSAAAPNTSAEDDITIGLFMPLTGSSSLMGNAGNNAAIMAIEEINAAGGILGRQVTLVSYDDKSSPEEAVRNVTRMLEVDEVDAIIGSLHSGNIQAVGDLVEEAMIPLMGTGTSPQWLQKGWTYLYRCTLNTYFSSLSAVQICEMMELETMAIFYSQDEYGKNGKDNMTELCEEYNIEIISVESMKPGDSDFTAQCTNIANSEPDVVYIIATTDNLPPMVKQIRANGYEGYIVGEQSLGSPEVKEIAGEGADGVIYGACFVMPVESPDEAVEPEIQEFFANYLERFGEMCPSEVAVRVYDGIYLLKDAMESAGTVDGPAVRDAIETISGYEGLQGSFNFVDQNGEGLTESRLYIIYEGKDILLDEYMAMG